jgi:hypothetical protein
MEVEVEVVTAYVTVLTCRPLPRRRGRAWRRSPGSRAPSSRGGDPAGTAGTCAAASPPPPRGGPRTGARAPMSSPSRGLATPPGRGSSWAPAAEATD